MTIIGEAFVILRPDTTGFGPASEGGIKKALEGLGPVGAIAGIGVAAGGALLEIGEKFQVAFNTIRQETGATDAQMVGLQQSFKNVFTSAIGANFKNVAADLSEVSIRSGLTGSALETLTKQFVELQHMDASANVQELTSVFGMFNVAAADQSRELDVLFKAHQVAGVSMAQLASDMKTAGPTVQFLNLNMDQTVSLISQVEKLGLPAAKSMSALSLEMARAAKAGEDPTKVIGSLIQQIKQAPTAVAALEVATKGFGVSGRQAGVFIKEVQDGVFNFGDTLGRITGGAGGIDATAQATATLGDKFKLLKNQVLTALEPTASAFLGFLEKGFEKAPEILNQVKEKLGPEVTKFKDEFMRGFEGGDAKGLTGFDAGFAKIGEAVRKLVHDLEPMIKDMLPRFQAAWDAISPVLEHVAEILVTDVMPIVVRVGEFLGKHFINELRLFADIVKFVGDLLQGHFKKAFHDLLDVLASPIRELKNLASLLKDVFGKAVDEATQAIAGGFMTALHAVGQFFTDLGSTITGAAADAFHAVTDFFVKLPGRILGALGEAAGWLLDVGKSAIDGLCKGITDTFHEVLDFLGSLPKRFLDFLGTVGGGALHWLEDLGIDVIRGLGNGLVHAAESLLGHIPFVGGKIVGMFKDALGVKSPSTIFHGIGLNLMEGLAAGIAAGHDLPQSALDRLRLGVATPGGAGNVGAAASGAQAQLLQVLQQIRTNTDPNHPLPQQQTTLLQQIRTNTDPNKQGAPAGTSAPPPLAFAIAR
jgi:hypothetical protein